MEIKRVQTRSSVDRPALVGVTLLGMALCSGGVGKVAASGQWLSVPGIAGTALGVVVLGVVGARLFGRELPLIKSDRAALATVVAVAATKFAVAAVFPLGA